MDTPTENHAIATAIYEALQRLCAEQGRKRAMLGPLTEVAIDIWPTVHGNLDGIDVPAATLLEPYIERWRTAQCGVN